MKILLVGEASAHRAQLERNLDQRYQIIDLPPEAAESTRFDDRIHEDDVVISLRFTREKGAAPAFRLLHVPGAGVDGVEVENLSPTTTVCNVYEHEIPIAEYVLGCLLEWEIRATQLRLDFTDERWPELYRHRKPHGEIHGKTLGLIGYGRVGRAIADRAHAFGLQTIAVTGSQTSDEFVQLLVPSRLDDLLEVSDYVVVACPLTAQTRGMLDGRAFHRMKSSAILVNPSRAAIVEESALYEALSTGVIAGAFLDVWYSHPTGSSDRVKPSDFPLLDLPNTWCTPHSSAWTENLFERRYAVIADNINRLMAGHALSNVVHY